MCGLCDKKARALWGRKQNHLYVIINIIYVCVAIKKDKYICLLIYLSI